MRIGLVAPPFERVPPVAYGGTERIVHALAVELDRRGHAVTVFASGDSIVPGRLVATVPLQVFAEAMATAKGHDVDQPRNLAKSVTVE